MQILPFLTYKRPIPWLSKIRRTTMYDGLSTIYNNNETKLGDTHSRFVMAMACGLSAHRLSFIEAIDLSD